MDLFSWMVGLPVGWSGGKILKRDGCGTVMDIAMGIGGSSGGRSSHAIAGLGGRWGGIGAPRGFRQRQKAVRAATLGVATEK